MTVTTALGRTFHLHFVHSSPDGKTREGAGVQRRALDHDANVIGRRLTLCEVSEVMGSNTLDGKEVYNVLGQGVGICHERDTFKKPVGRKVSLGAALKASGLGTGIRAEIWAAYLAQFGITAK